eukprot:1159113-Pelagomonas_calceolata.AAC.7
MDASLTSFWQQGLPKPSCPKQMKKFSGRQMNGCKPHLILAAGPPQALVPKANEKGPLSACAQSSTIPTEQRSRETNKGRKASPHSGSRGPPGSSAQSSATAAATSHRRCTGQHCRSPHKAAFHAGCRSPAMEARGKGKTLPHSFHTTGSVNVAGASGASRLVVQDASSTLTTSRSRKQSVTQDASRTLTTSRSRKQSVTRAGTTEGCSGHTSR